VSRPLVPEARPGYREEAKLREYYVRGVDQWYLWWGNNPFDYEHASAVRWLTPVARPLAQLGAIAQGVQPQAVALATEANADMRAAIGRLRWHLSIVALSMLAGAVLLLRVLVRTWRTGHRRPLAWSGSDG
jgi:hypothetical protein